MTSNVCQSVILHKTNLFIFSEGLVILYCSLFLFLWPLSSFFYPCFHCASLLIEVVILLIYMKNKMFLLQKMKILLLASEKSYIVVSKQNYTKKICLLKSVDICMYSSTNKIIKWKGQIKFKSKSNILWIYYQIRVLFPIFFIRK